MKKVLHLMCLNFMIVGSLNHAHARVNNAQSAIITDYLGTPVEMYDSKGERTWAVEYDIYGKVRKQVKGKVDDCPFRYQGQYEDVETNLYYNRFRYYNPDSGQYISQDPIGLAGNNPNLYAYTKDSNSWIDVFGLSECSLKNIKEVDKQKLPNWVMDSFENSDYKTVVTTADVTLYRVFGGNAKSTGAFASTKKATNSIQAKIDNALLPEWKNTRVYEAEIIVPKGTVLNLGKVAPQETLPGSILKGGADQVLLPQGWPSSWIKGVSYVPI